MLRPSPQNPTWSFDDGYRQNQVLRYNVGEQIRLRMRIKLRDGTPADSSNSRICLMITDRVLGSELWSQDWTYDRITPLDVHGLYEILILPRDTARWRAGTYAAELRLSDLQGDDTRTVYEFFVAMRYSAGSPHKDVPYDTL